MLTWEKPSEEQSKVLVVALEIGPGAVGPKVTRRNRRLVAQAGRAKRCREGGDIYGVLFIRLWSKMVNCSADLIVKRIGKYGCFE